MNTEALRRAHAATTPGEWRPMDAPEDNGNFSACLYAEGYGVVGYWRGHKGWHSDANWLLTQDDAHFIALAHKEVPALIDRIEALEAENARLREDLAKANGAQWFYLGDECSSDNCRFSIDECIDEDFLHYNRAEGRHAVLISGARAVPDMWLALTFLTEKEKDEREDDEPYTFTIHGSEEDARAALGEQS